MDVILTEDQDKLGKAGEVVLVKPGFARNYLFPHHRALPATPENLKAIERIKARRLAALAKEKDDAAALAQRLAALSLTIRVRVGEQDRLFGTVTPHDIARALEEEGVIVDKRKIHLTEPIKTLGTYQVPLKLHPEVETTLKLWVVKE